MDETLRKENNVAKSEVNKAMKNALRVIQAAGKLSSVKQVDSGPFSIATPNYKIMLKFYRACLKNYSEYL